MDKVTRQKVAQYREKIAKEYKNKLYALQSENRGLKKQLEYMQAERDALEDKVRQLSNWVDRLQDYINLTDEQLEKIKKQIDKPNMLSEFTKISSIIDAFSRNYGIDI